MGALCSGKQIAHVKSEEAEQCADEREYTCLLDKSAEAVAEAKNQQRPSCIRDAAKQAGCQYAAGKVFFSLLFCLALGTFLFYLFSELPVSCFLLGSHDSLALLFHILPFFNSYPFFLPDAFFVYSIVYVSH